MSDVDSRLVGRGVVLAFVAVLVVASFAVGVTAVSDTVTIHESVGGAEISVASDGQTVFIKASDGTTTGPTTDTVTADVGSGTLSVTVRDNGQGDDDVADDGVYWGNVTITSGSTDASTNTVSVSDGNSVSVSVDLDGQGDGGSASLTADYTAPDLSSAKTAGTDGNGDVDEINVTFTESVNDSTVDAGDFSLDTGSVDSVSTGDTADDENVTLAVSGLSGTDATPDVTLAAGGVEDEAGNSIGSQTTVTSTDGTAPIQIGNRYDDVDEDGTVDTLKVTFSEPVDGSTFVDDDWSITGTGDPNIQSLSDVRQGSTTSEVLINVTADENVTGRQTSTVDNPKVKYDGASNNVTDSAGNGAQTQTKTYIDVADPSVKSIEYLDTDGDGTVDRIDVTFTEFIDDSESSGADAADFTISGSDSGSVTKGTLTIPDTSDNTEAQLGVTGPADDTGLALELAYSGTKIEDARSNIANQFSATSVDDGAAPVVSSFSLTTDDANEELDVSFDATESLSTISVSVSGPESDTLTSFSQSGSTLSASLSVSTSGDYTATLDTADDSAGNSASSSPTDTASITISTPTPTPTPTPESSSGGGGNSNPSELSDTSSAVRISGTTGLSEVGVRFSGARAGTLRATEVTSLAPPTPPGLFVTAVDITVADSLTETPSTLKFAIARARLDDLGVNPGDLTVYRLHDGEWNALETRVVDRGSDTVVVEADTPGFSRFAVMAGGEEQSTATSASTPEPATETEADTPDPDTATETVEPEADTPMATEDETVTETQTPGFGVGVALVALVAVLLVGLRRRD